MSPAPGTSPTFVTAALAPELPYARVLAESVAAHHPGARMVIVAADGEAPDGLPAGVEGVGVAELGLDVPPAEVAVLALSGRVSPR